MAKQGTIQVAVRISLMIFLLIAVMALPVAKTPRQAEAQLITGEIPYGGHQIFWFPCTCSGNTLHVIFDYRTLRPLSLVYQPGLSVLYLYYNVFGTYLLGSYQPFTGGCFMYVGISCVPYPSEGLMGNRPGTGTSLY